MPSDTLYNACVDEPQSTFDLTSRLSAAVEAIDQLSMRQLSDDQRYRRLDYVLRVFSACKSYIRRERDRYALRARRVENSADEDETVDQAPDHAYLSAGDNPYASGDIAYHGCSLCGRPRSEHRQ